jgi:hypothetical protein
MQKIWAIINLVLRLRPKHLLLPPTYLLLLGDRSPKKRKKLTTEEKSELYASKLTEVTEAEIAENLAGIRFSFLNTNTDEEILEGILVRLYAQRVLKLMSSLRSNLMIGQVGKERDGDYVCQVVKGLYGFKQSGLMWNRELYSTLRRQDFVLSWYDPCLYVLKGLI